MAHLANFETYESRASRPQLRLARLHLDAPTFRRLFQELGPSLGFWRAAEIAALREQTYSPPVLDLGCGDGFVTSMILSSVEFGLDPDDGCRKRAATRGIYEKFISTTAERARVRAGSIGTVISNSVLEHIEELDSVLAAVYRMLRPGGRLIFTVPTEAFTHSLALPFGRYTAWRNRQLMHRNLWALATWAEHLTRAGFLLEEVRPYLRSHLVRRWDAMDLAQQLWIGPYRIAGLLWKSLPVSALDRLAQSAAHADLSSDPPGCGRLVVAVKS